MFEQYPGWARKLGQRYLTRTLNQFILHGNVHDLIPVRNAESREYHKLEHFLSNEIFGSRDYVLFYDRSSGIYFRDESTREDFFRVAEALDHLWGTGYADHPPKAPVKCFALLESYFRSRLKQQKSIGLIINYADTIVPGSDVSMYGSEERDALVYLLRWAHDNMFLSADFTTVLISENRSDLNHNLVQNPYTSDIHISLPDRKERLQYIEGQQEEFDLFEEDMNADILARTTAGLNLVHLQGILANARENRERISLEQLSQRKKGLIEAEAYSLLEFVSTRRTLDDVAGHTEAKKHLRETARALKKGREDVIPMGYLVCGPVGTGKTYMVQCFAGEIGIPMVKLKNFRSQWQGVTEGNLEKILNILKAMAPVAVMIDEADAYLGDRNQRGDSGVSQRVFSQISSFMSDTDYRGRILWFLMTARPDLMPVDLKRQGRAEEHISLFPPQTRKQRIALFEAMKQKTGLKMTEPHCPAILEQGEKNLSGADMEAALTRAKFRAAALGNEAVTPEVLDQALEDFLPPTYPNELELQTLSAVLECTSKALLPDKYRTMDREEITRRVQELKRSLDN